MRTLNRTYNAKCELVMVSVHSVLLTRCKSTIRSEKGKTPVGQLNCVRGWWDKSRGWWGNSHHFIW